MPSSFKCTPSLSKCEKSVQNPRYLHHGKGIPIVIVGELLWRHPNKVGDEYNPKVVDTNVLIRQKLTTGNKDNIFMWVPHLYPNVKSLSKTHDVST
jgi:hypothetical protein